MADKKLLGIFPWYTLATKEPQKTADFYCKLLGLKTSEFEIKGMGKTTMLEANGAGFADVSNLPPSTPCHWAAYITVDNVDQFVPKAKKLGGTIEGQPFDIPTIGRAVVVKDPVGATFMAFTPLDWNDTKSAMGMQEGAICWNELMIDDPKKAIPFYSECFGWKFKKGENMGDIEYHSFTTMTGEQAGGIMKRPAKVPQMPAMWMTYFMVKDVEASAKKAQTLGGKMCVPPTEIPHTGTFSMIQDPQGGMFYLFKGQ